ncbi:MAG: protein TolR [Myxococcales bacterium]|nr:protein TolR [Myxococcales bacterium]
MTGAGGSSDPTMSEINVTPLVDVMLVLLIIFMVTAPLMQQGVQVALPQTQAQNIQEDQQRLILSITREQKIFIGQTEVDRETLEQKLLANEKLKRDKEIYLQADRAIPYGFVVDVMAVMKRAGVESVGMLTEPPEKDKK